MKVLLVNGSPNGHGCTYTALKEIEKTLRAEGVETEMFSLGNKPKCVQEDVVNKLLPKALEADGIVLGAPVHYASAAGQASCAYDRLFVMSNGAFANKLGAAVVSCRRGGATATFDQLNKYFTISNMHTGIRCMAIRRMRSSRIWKACRTCAPSGEIWLGC